jgi:hypothetical protein
MSLGASMLRGSHWGSDCIRDNRSGGDHSGSRRYALHYDDDNATDDVLHLGSPIWHVPADLTRDPGSISLGASMLQGSHCGSNRNLEGLVAIEHQTLPKAFYCPIICKLISDPFITPDGITYEYEAATEWIHVSGQSPLNENPLLLSHFHDSNALYELIQIP